MKGKVNRAFGIYSEHGMSELTKIVFDEIRSKLLQKYYVKKGKKTYAIKDTSGVFDVSDEILYHKTNKIHRIEKRQIEAVLSAVNDGDVFYDVGAHIGMFSCFVTQNLHNGNVVSFEPNPYSLPYLESNIKLNQKGNVNNEIMKIALSNQYGSSRLSQPANEIADGLSFLTSGSAQKGTVVETAPADGLISEGKIQPPNVVKIDVEGAEPLVIVGMEKTLSREDCRLVLVEVHPPRNINGRPSISDFNSSIEDMTQKLKKLRFDVNLLNTSRSEPFIIAQK